VKPESRTSGSLILAPSLTRIQNRWFSDIWTTNQNLQVRAKSNTRLTLVPCDAHQGPSFKF
jgi:hypothetical protein